MYVDIAKCENLLTPEETKKSLEMAMTGWKVRSEVSHKIGKGRYD